MAARNIHIKRVYEPASENDGRRVLVDRLWPRGLTKDKARIDLWLKEIAPSNGLRKWYSHDPAKWDEFRKRYFEELDKSPAHVEELEKVLEKGKVTLLYQSREEAFNNAVALKEYVTSLKVKRGRR